MSSDVRRRRVRDPAARVSVSRDLGRGLICRADDRGDPVIQLSPPLIATQSEFDRIVGVLGDVLERACVRIGN
jgi:adenosylmethionine-8-amino-7-oxononanoate aminotransferase